MPLTILVAEADGDVQDAAGWLLSAQRHRVLTAGDLAAATWALDVEACDVVIADWRLLSAGGAQAAALLDHPGIVIVARQGDPVPAEKVVLHPPLSMAALIGIVRMVAGDHAPAAPRGGFVDAMTSSTLRFRRDAGYQPLLG